MLDTLLFVLANLLLLIFGYRVLICYPGSEKFSTSEKICASFIIGLVINFIVFFLAGWSQVGFSWIIPTYVVMGIGVSFDLFRKGTLSWKWQFSNFPKYHFSWTHIPLAILTSFIIFRVFFSLFNAIHLPAYFDDEKGNWNLKSKVIYQSDAIKLDPTNPETYLGGDGHKEYPLAFILYKTYISKFLGHWSDAHTALIHPIFFYGGLIIVILGLFSSWPLRIITLYLVTSLPLVSWHAGVSYFDLVIAMELLLMYSFFLRYSETKNRSYIFMIVWIVILTLNTKNEGTVLVLPALLPMFYGIAKEKMFTHKKEFLLLLAPLLLAVPHMLFRIIYYLPLNPTSAVAKYSWHADAPGLLYDYFFRGGSYNIFWYMFVCILSVILISKKCQIQKEERILLASLSILFFLILAVFFFTNNYQFLLDQTTIHRTMLIFIVPATIIIGKIYATNYFKY